MDPKRLRIVIVDDNPDDRALVRRELERELPGATFGEAIDLASFERSTAAPYDLLVTDFQLKWGTGMEVLERSKALRPETPVIMFTGTGSQEIAVQAMKSGLDDYVVKSAPHLVRLRSSVRGALARAESRQRTAELEVRLRTLLELLEVGVFRSDLYGELRECNSAFLRLLGVGSADEATRAGAWPKIRWPQGQPGALDLLYELGRKSTHHATIRRASGEEVSVRVKQVMTGSESAVVIDGLVEEVGTRRP